MKKIFSNRGYRYPYAILLTISMTAITGCSQVPTKTKECPPTKTKECPSAEIIIRGSVQSVDSDSLLGT